MIAATVATLTDLGFLWFREFYLESSRVIQVHLVHHLDHFFLKKLYYDICIYTGLTYWKWYCAGHFWIVRWRMKWLLAPTLICFVITRLLYILSLIQFFMKWPNIFRLIVILFEILNAGIYVHHSWSLESFSWHVYKICVEIG